MKQWLVHFLVLLLGGFCCLNVGKPAIKLRQFLLYQAKDHYLSSNLVVESELYLPWLLSYESSGVSGKGGYEETNSECGNRKRKQEAETGSLKKEKNFSNFGFPVLFASYFRSVRTETL